MARLTDENRQVIFERHEAGDSITEIAKALGRRYQVIRNAVHSKWYAEMKSGEGEVEEANDQETTQEEVPDADQLAQGSNQDETVSDDGGSESSADVPESTTGPGGTPELSESNESNQNAPLLAETEESDNDEGRSGSETGADDAVHLEFEVSVPGEAADEFEEEWEDEDEYFTRLGSDVPVENTEASEEQSASVEPDDDFPF